MTMLLRRAVPAKVAGDLAVRAVRTKKRKVESVELASGKVRCDWPGVDNELYARYHDEEWGVAVHDDHKLFEMLTLEGAQAGLSWFTVLKKRDNYRQAFSQFDPSVVATFSDSKIDELMQNEGLIRHRGKLQSTVTNAKGVLAVQKEFGSFDKYLWGFAPKHRFSSPVLPKTPESERMSKDLKQRGFAFCGPTVCYALMQAVGMVDDHMEHCWKYQGPKKKRQSAGSVQNKK